MYPLSRSTGWKRSALNVFTRPKARHLGKPRPQIMEHPNARTPQYQNTPALEHLSQPTHPPPLPPTHSPTSTTALYNLQNGLIARIEDHACHRRLQITRKRVRTRYCTRLEHSTYNTDTTHPRRCWPWSGQGRLSVVDTLAR